MILKPKWLTKLEPGHWASKGLVGCWIFNEGGGDLAYDTSGNGNHGTFIGDTHFVPGRDGPALGLDGFGDRVNVPIGDADVLTLGDGDYTVMAWIKSELLGDEGILTFDEFDPAWTIREEGNMYGFDGIFFGNSTLVITANKWHHVAWVRRSTATNGLYYYINGVEDSTRGTHSATIPSVTTLEIGTDRLGGNPATDFTGSICELKIYNRAMSASEINSLYLDSYQMFKRGG